MKLLTKEIHAKMYANHKATMAANGDDLGHKPVVKLFNPVGAGTWLLTEIDEYGCCFGPCDLGMGFPELGPVMLSELEAVKGPLGLGIERDVHWTADKTLAEYAEEARLHDRIIA